MNVGQLVKYRRVDVEASFKADHRSGVWVDDLGIIIKGRHPRDYSGKDYLLRVFFPSRLDSPIRTLRASKLESVS